MSIAPTKINPLSMSDEDFGQLNSPSEVADAPAPTAEEQAAAEAAAAQAVLDEEARVADEAAADAGGGDTDDGKTGEDGDDELNADGTKKDDLPGSAEGPKLDADGNPIDESGAAAGVKGDKSGQDLPGDTGKVAGKEGEAVGADGKPLKPAAVAADPDYKAMYEQIIAPFKANGKTITLKDPAEVVQLMQMGANYTRKMQELQPHRKMLMMLQSNDLNEEKLSYLIDLDKKNPEAIKKLLKDSGIDPLDIDTTIDSGYKPGVHQLTDNEVTFRSTLDDLSQTQEGKDTIVEVNTRFDEASKEAIWKQPTIMAVIHEQRESGVYAMITEEMDRQITLGTIPVNTPFLEAYKMVGDQMSAAATGSSSSGKEPGADDGQAGKPAPIVVGTRVATPKAAVANDDAASAAASSRGSPSSKAPTVHPFAMSDEQFMKQMEGRV